MSTLFRRCFLASLCILLITINSDTYTLNPVEITAYKYSHDLLFWEASNILSKWTHRIKNYAQLKDFDSDYRNEQLRDYFKLSTEITKIKLNIAKKSASTSPPYIDISNLENAISRLQIHRENMERDVEETLESEIQKVLIDQELNLWGDYVFPPVDIKLTQIPNLLVTSPRTSIDRSYELLLKPTITLKQIENLESELLGEFDLSALVTPIGGIATYPASVANYRPLKSILQTSVHEWLHHYFFFKPLGINMFTSKEMQLLNETAADIAGIEIGSIVLSKIEPELANTTNPFNTSQSIFDYADLMRETRIVVEEFLLDGNIAEAEQYMEKQRQIFVENGFYIRKLNQAYFAFHGTYANSPMSISPIGEQLKVFRSRFQDVGSFIREISKVGSYNEFLEVIDN